MFELSQELPWEKEEKEIASDWRKPKLLAHPRKSYPRTVVSRNRNKSSRSPVVHQRTNRTRLLFLLLPVPFNLAVPLLRASGHGQARVTKGCREGWEMNKSSRFTVYRFKPQKKQSMAIERKDALKQVLCPAAYLSPTVRCFLVLPPGGDSRRKNHSKDVRESLD